VFGTVPAVLDDVPVVHDHPPAVAVVTRAGRPALFAAAVTRPGATGARTTAPTAAAAGPVIGRVDRDGGAHRLPGGGTCRRAAAQQSARGQTCHEPDSTDRHVPVLRPKTPWMQVPMGIIPAWLARPGGGVILARPPPGEAAGVPEAGVR
jgi:hypothetical protein